MMHDYVATAQAVAENKPVIYHGKSTKLTRMELCNVYMSKIARLYGLRSRAAAAELSEVSKALEILGFAPVVF